MEANGKNYSIIKKELLFIPFFGWALACLKPIHLRRSKKYRSLKKVITHGSKKINKGFSLIIFPEGTRKLPGSKPDYKTGFIGIYQHTKRNILPVAVNSGLCWPKHTWILKSGLIKGSFIA